MSATPVFIVFSKCIECPCREIDRIESSKQSRIKQEKEPAYNLHRDADMDDGGPDRKRKFRSQSSDASTNGSKNAQRIKLSGYPRNLSRDARKDDVTRHVVKILIVDVFPAEDYWLGARLEICDVDKELIGLSAGSATGLHRNHQQTKPRATQ